MAGANIRAMLVTTTLLLISAGNSSLSIPASVTCSHRKLFAFASHSALSAPKTTSASGSTLFNSSASARSAICTSLPCDAICLISAAVNLAGPTTEAAVTATIRTPSGGGSNTAIRSDASRMGAAGTAAAAAMNNRRDTGLSSTIFSFSVCCRDSALPLGAVLPRPVTDHSALFLPLLQGRTEAPAAAPARWRPPGGSWQPPARLLLPVFAKEHAKFLPLVPRRPLPAVDEIRLGPRLAVDRARSHHRNRYTPLRRRLHLGARHKSGNAGAMWGRLAACAAVGYRRRPVPTRHQI